MGCHWLLSLWLLKLLNSQTDKHGSLWTWIPQRKPAINMDRSKCVYYKWLIFHLQVNLPESSMNYKTVPHVWSLVCGPLHTSQRSTCPIIGHNLSITISQYSNTYYWPVLATNHSSWSEGVQVWRNAAFPQATSTHRISPNSPIVAAWTVARKTLGLKCLHSSLALSIWAFSACLGSPKKAPCQRSFRQPCTCHLIFSEMASRVLAPKQKQAVELWLVWQSFLSSSFRIGVCSHVFASLSRWVSTPPPHNLRISISPEGNTPVRVSSTFWDPMYLHQAFCPNKSECVESQFCL